MESWLDVLSKALAAGEVSRREALRRVSGAASGVLLAALGIGCAEDTAGPDAGGGIDAVRGRCKKVGQKCRQDAECCSSFCPPQTGKCSCPPDTTICPNTGQCIFCDSGQVLNPNTCQCECLESCETCSAGGTCDAGDFGSCGGCGAVCFTTVEGTPFCGSFAFCSDLPPCTTTGDCPTGWACTVNTCCGVEGVCSPPCGTSAVATGLSAARTGPMNASR